MAVNDNLLGASGTNINEAREGALRDILKQTSGGTANANRAMSLAQQLYPDTPKADPWEAAFSFFAEMGKAASVPGSTALGAAVSSMAVPLDYLTAKKAEKNETDRARTKTALSLGSSLNDDAGTVYKVQSSKILDGNVTITVFSDGRREVTGPDGNIVTGETALRVITEAENRGIEIQGDRSQQRGLGEGASKIVFDSYDQMATVRDNISTLEDAKRALESGAQTGFFAQFLPNISRSATELANVKNRLGLDVVSSVTFGALSESELNMALDTALPTNMDEDYLKDWVQERIDAKKKLLKNLLEVTGFLSRGNSIGDWMEELDKRATTSQNEITALATEISTMSIEEIDAIDLATAGLSNAELTAYIKRAKELGAN